MDEPKFRVLGPIEMHRAESPVRVTGNTLIVLAGLLLSANDIVSTDQIAEWVWAKGLPDHPRAALHNSLSRLRRLCGPKSIETVAGGYRLITDSEHLDVLRFRDLTASAAASLRADAAEEAAELLDEALGLWRQPLFGNLDSPVLTHDFAARLSEQYMSAQEARARVCLRLGRYDDVTDALPPLVRAHPFREAMAGSLMTALMASGRRAEALATYQSVRCALREELGIEPSQRLRELHLQMLQESQLLMGGRSVPPSEYVYSHVLTSTVGRRTNRL
jgi:DNA-binding SARP family transcriptional activator